MSAGFVLVRRMYTREKGQLQRILQVGLWELPAGRLIPVDIGEQLGGK